MQRFVFYLLIPFLYLFSILPFWVLYRLSDLTFIFLYHVTKYRRTVVTKNIQNSFPEKSPAEVLKTERAFYRHLCDLIIEAIKMFTISKATILKRCKFNEASLALLDRLYKEKKSLILVMGHYGNWEWGGLTFSLKVKHQLYFIYKPISNKQVDSLVYNMRSRFGAKLIAMNNAFREMVTNRDTINATAFIADQAPAPEGAHWTTFLHQDTPVFTGTGKIAKKLNYPVVFINIKKIRRGYYELYAELLAEDPKFMTEGEISDLHTQRLEKEIISQPEFWLWSHKRWKHKRPML